MYGVEDLKGCVDYTISGKIKEIPQLKIVYTSRYRNVH